MESLNRVVLYYMVEAKKHFESQGVFGPLTIAQFERYLSLKGIELP